MSGRDSRGRRKHVNRRHRLEDLLGWNHRSTIPGHQVLTAGYQEPLASTTLPGADAVRIVLIGLRSPVSTGFSYRVVFAFEQAGELCLELPVENPTTPRSPAHQPLP